MWYERKNKEMYPSYDDMTLIPTLGYQNVCCVLSHGNFTRTLKKLYSKETDRVKKKKQVERQYAR